MTGVRTGGRPPPRGDSAESERSGIDSARSDDLGGVVRRGVELGYRVVEEQIQQGQRVAQECSQRSYDPPAMGDDYRESSERLMRYYQDAGQLWIEFIRTFLGGATQMGSVFGAPYGQPREERSPRADPASARSRAPRREAPPPPRQPEPAASPASPGPDPGPNQGARVRVEIVGSVVVRPWLDLNPEADVHQLATTELPALDGGSQPLTDVTFEPGMGGGAPRLRIHVPEGAAAGIYLGVVVDRRTRRPVGTLQVEVGA